MSSAVIGPELTDGVVLVRPPVEGDAAAIFAACQDPEVSRFTPLPAPYEWHHAAEWIAGAPEAWRSRTSTPMVVVDANTGELLGACGLTDMDEDQAEIGYWVKRPMRGSGVATRAVLLVTQWALTDLGLSLIELLADVRNVASHRVAEKAGYTRDGEVPPPARAAGRCERMVRFVCSDADAWTQERSEQIAGRSRRAEVVRSRGGEDSVPPDPAGMARPMSSHAVRYTPSSDGPISRRSTR